jgi:hypothetical protein
LYSQEAQKFFCSLKVKGILFFSLFQPVIGRLYDEVGFNAAEENIVSVAIKSTHLLIEGRQTHVKEHLTKY